MIEEKTMYRVKCDKCGEYHREFYEDIIWTDTARGAEESAMNDGWVQTKSGKFFCLHCKEEGEAWNEAMAIM